MQTIEKEDNGTFSVYVDGSIFTSGFPSKAEAERYIEYFFHAEFTSDTELEAAESFPYLFQQ